MVNLKRKNCIILSVCGGILLLGGLIALLLLLPKKRPDPRALLQEAQNLSAQNLCLMAILEQEPEDIEAAEQLMENYRALGVDPLTLYATGQTYGLPAGESRGDQAEEAGRILSAGGIAGRKDHKGAYAAARGADTIYYATNEGIYADYRGLKVKISGILAEGLTAAEGGIYFINTDQRKVQYLARDGHKIQTLSMIDAQSFAFFNEKLWIIGKDGALYCDGAAMETPAPLRMLAATADTLYASINDESGRAAGVLTVDREGRIQEALPSPAFTLFGGSDGCLYYINEHSYPMRYDPQAKEAAILAEKKAVAVTCEDGTVYYLNEKGKIKKIA